MRAVGRWIFRLALACALAVALGYLPYRAGYGPDGVTRALRLESDLNQLVGSNKKLRKENHALRKKIKSLKTDRSVIEQVARDELGMVRPEDIVFQLK
jgi:cell division protein FtsB